MMHSQKVQTQLTHFRYSKDVDKNIYQIEWFYYDVNEMEMVSRGFTHEEEKVVISYFVRNKFNFPGGINNFTVSQGEQPKCGFENSTPDETLIMPKNVILSLNPRIIGTSILPCMDIILIGHDNRALSQVDLPFTILGRLISRLEGDEWKIMV